ncbi:MAG: GNAT family N-acetyltransferase [Actinobacteria bacterium]|nr:GNAT family N-acetyltransferase [Actinomycetota bacterium]
MYKIVQAVEDPQIEAVKRLFVVYRSTVDNDLCFIEFERELEGLPGDYAPPRGRLLLTSVDGEPAGCIALAPVDDKTCEMRRLFVRTKFRGEGIGRSLVIEVIHAARKIGYEEIWLETLESMTEAIELYNSLGFEITAVEPGAVAMKLSLT